MQQTAPRTSYRMTGLAGMLGLFLLVGGGIGWASFAHISGAVLANGNVVVAGKPKTIQHLDGGLVREIRVNSGARVQKDDVLIVLDSTTIAANLKIYERRLRDALVERSRLIAELSDEADFAPPTDETETYELGDITTALLTQRTLMHARRQARENQLAQYDEKIAQFRNQTTGMTGLVTEKKKQLDSFRNEIADVSDLAKRGITSRGRLLDLQRAEADIQGQLAEHDAEILRLENAISEAILARDGVNRVFREKALEELKALGGTIDELVQQLDATRAQLARIEIRAPVAGTVHELNTFTIGGVVQPGATVMQIVPETDVHELEIYVDPISIDQIELGREAIIRFPAFNRSTTPELKASVTTMSPASVVDEASGATYFRVIVGLIDGEARHLEGKTLVPGMPVEAVFPTSERTVLSFLVKPLMDHLEHVFREE